MTWRDLPPPQEEDRVDLPPPRSMLLTLALEVLGCGTLGLLFLYACLYAAEAL